MLYSEEDLDKSMEKIETIDFHEVSFIWFTSLYASGLLVIGCTYALIDVGYLSSKKK